MSTLTSADVRLSITRRSVPLPALRRGTRRRASQKLSMFLDAMRRTWNSNPFATTHSMMRESACSKWMDRCASANQNSTSSKSAYMTQEPLHASKPWLRQCNVKLKTTSPPCTARTTSFEWACQRNRPCRGWSCHATSPTKSCFYLTSSIQSIT